MEPTILQNPSPEALSSWLSGRLAGRNAVVLNSLEQLQGRLYPEEEALLGRAIPKRALEFRAGRTAARMGLEKLSLEPGPILMGRKREPLWPEGCVGTISHCGSHCLAAVAPAVEIRSLGADIELLGRVKPDLWPRILVTAEKGYIASLGRDDQVAAATIIFSAKEAFFKLQYPLTGNWLEFLDAEVVLEPGNRFRIRVSKILPGLDPSASFTGSYAEWRGCGIALMSI